MSRKTRPIILDRLYDHGEVCVILPAAVSPWKEGEQEKWFETIEEKLRRFEPDRDFLVWAGGDTFAAVMVGMALANMQTPIWKFNWLRYDRKVLPDGSRTDVGAVYVPVLIDLEYTDETQIDDEYDHEGSTKIGGFDDESP